MGKTFILYYDISPIHNSYILNTEVVIVYTARRKKPTY